MRVNIYAEEMTNKVELITKTIDGQEFVGVRFYLELPVTIGQAQMQGPFIHRAGDDDSSAVTFWGKRALKEVLQKALQLLEPMPTTSIGGERRPLDLGKPVRIEGRVDSGVVNRVWEADGVLLTEVNWSNGDTLTIPIRLLVNV